MPEPTFEAAGGRIARRADRHPLCDGFFLASGAIPRVTSYETGLVGHHSFHGEGWRAKALAQAFAPGRYGPSVVGSTYALGG